MNHTPPRVFISYSHDTAEHKKWVLQFATTLRDRGIDAILDQWDLIPGDDLPYFMETNLANSDYIIMICTETYVQKANKGTGGVGYEKMIITSSLLGGIDNNKVIPIIRQESTNEVPTFLKSKLYIDFSKDKDIEYNLDELIRTLLKAPLYEKPEIGKNPFKPMTESTPNRTADGLKELMKIITKCYDKRTESYIFYTCVVVNSEMHRLTLDKYINIAIKSNLIAKEHSNTISITKEGLNYLELHEIISG
jgi:hypothetical protein